MSICWIFFQSCQLVNIRRDIWVRRKVQLTFIHLHQEIESSLQISQ